MEWFGRRMLRPDAVLLLALFVCLGWLGTRDITTSHEARVVQTARLMAASGWPWRATPVETARMSVRADRDGQFAVPRYDLPPLRVNPWLVPVLNGQIRLQKPPLPNWCTAILFRLLGECEFTSRLTPALLAALSTLLVADLARMLLGRAAGAAAGLVWAGTFIVVTEFREMTPDPFLAFFTLAAVWAWIRATLRRGSSSRAFLLIVFYASLGLGIMSKGPFVLLHVAIALLAFSYCRPRRRPRVGWGFHVTGMLLLLAIALPWPIYIFRSVENVGTLWKMETTRGGGSTGVGAILRDSWQFLPRLFELSLPWTPIWIAGVVASLRESRARRRRLFPLLWCAATVLVFSFSPEKKDAYLLPMIPAQTLLTTMGVLAIARMLRRVSGGNVQTARTLVAIQSLVGIGFFAIGVWTLHNWGADQAVTTGVGIAVGIVALLLLAIAWRANVERPSGFASLRKWFVPQAVGLALASVMLGTLAHAVRDNERSAKPLGTLVSPRFEPPANVLVSRLAAEGSVYLPIDVRYDPRATELYDMVEMPRGNKFKIENYRPALPSGVVTNAETVPVTGEPKDKHWKFIRLTVDPDATQVSPVERSAPGGG